MTRRKEFLHSLNIIRNNTPKSLEKDRGKAIQTRSFILTQRPENGRNLCYHDRGEKTEILLPIDHSLRRRNSEWVSINSIIAPPRSEKEENLLSNSLLFLNLVAINRP